MPGIGVSPDTENTLEPRESLVPSFLYCSAPRRMIISTLTKVSTLLITVGFFMNPLVVG